MAENGVNFPSPAGTKNRKSTSFPKLFTGFASLKAFSDNFEAVMSPTSILDSFKNSFRSDSGTPKIPEPETQHKLGTRGVSLGIVDVLRDDDSGFNPLKPETRMIKSGSQLKIQIPPLCPSVPSSPKSPPEFGIKTRNSQLGLFSSSPAKKSGFGSTDSPRIFTGCLSTTEMELSEDYTCVISHGPIPRTTHIFDDCVIGGFPGDQPCFQSENFLSFCYTCKKNIGQGKDIFMYKGEKAFCSRKCRHHEMVLDEGMDKLDSDDKYGACS